MTSNTKTFVAASASFLAGLVVGRARIFRRNPARGLLKSNYGTLTRQERKTAAALVDMGQGHLLESWPRPGIRDDAKRRLMVEAKKHVDCVPDDLENARTNVVLPPKTIKKPKKLEKHGDERVDNYYWLRDDKREDPEVLAHLKEENDYVKLMLKDTEELQEKLFKEMKGRIKEDDSSVPQRSKGFFYYTRTEEGQQYRVRCRRAVQESLGAPNEADTMDDGLKEEILLDENKEAKKHSYYVIGGFSVSPDHQLMAYAEDTEGGERYTLKVVDLSTRKQLAAVPGTSGNFVWANDNATLMYVVKDEKDRPYKVFRHKVGGSGEDEVVYHEEDEQFYIGVGRSRDDELLFISGGSAVTSYEMYLPASEPEGAFKPVIERANNVEYDVRHRDGFFYMTYRDATKPNSELRVAPVDNPTKTRVLLAHRPTVKIEGISLAKNFLTVFERREGLQRAVVYALPEGPPPTKLANGKDLTFDDPAYEMGPGSQGDFDSDILRITYTSLTTPASVMDHNMGTDNRVTKKVNPVLGGFDRASYQSERLWCTSHDGTKVPISLVYRPDAVQLDGTDAMLLDAYGSYEIPNDPYFSSARLSLLDRGVVFAIAHVRGGGELGRLWYENGKYLSKRNTFLDFIAAAEHLISAGYTCSEKLCISGRSAGGLTMGAVVNMAPHLFKAAIFGVPFVDVLTTMLDPSIPLTEIEWEEWGNPEDKTYYEYMKSYSPMDNIAPVEYPNILITAGLKDPRVGYWEPAKFAAKLRELKTDGKPVLFKCDMHGHFSQSGRFDRLKDVALEYAFLLKMVGLLPKESD